MYNMNMFHSFQQLLDPNTKKLTLEKSNCFVWLSELYTNLTLNEMIFLFS